MGGVQLDPVRPGLNGPPGCLPKGVDRFGDLGLAHRRRPAKVDRVPHPRRGSERGASNGLSPGLPPGVHQLEDYRAAGTVDGVHDLSQAGDHRIGVDASLAPGGAAERVHVEPTGNHQPHLSLSQSAVALNQPAGHLTGFRSHRLIGRRVNKTILDRQVSQHDRFK